MSSPKPSFDRRKLHELAAAAMDGAADEHQLRALTELLRASPEARDEYLTLVDLHATLASGLEAAPSPHESGEVRPTPHRREIPIAAAVAALAACLLVAFTWFGPDAANAQRDSFATMAQATEAVWDSGSLKIGNRIGPATLQLKSGLVRLEFDSGVEVTLEGPAVFKLVNIAKTELESGVLTATVPSGAEGFTVDTPSAQVIDLGTSFGIELTSDGFSNVSVFEGEVEVAMRNQDQQEASGKRLLSEGDSVRIGMDYEVQDIEFDSKPFEKIWPFASGIVGSTETIEFVPPWPRQIRFVRSDDRVFVRPEGRAVQLEAELQVNITKPGECQRPDDLSPSVLPPKETVRSYILHFSPESQLGPRRAKRVAGAITFDRPVLGIVVRHEELLASSHRFGRRSAGEANQRRELSLTGDEMGDRISLSEDRKTVSLDFISPGRSSDLVRVIVESTGGFQPPRRKDKN